MHTTLKSLSIGGAGLAMAAALLASPAVAQQTSAGHAAAEASAVARGDATPEVNLNLATSSAQLKKCFPHARAHVKVLLTTDKVGKDTFDISASGLRPRTSFTVFLLEKATPKFGAAEYIGDFTTDRHGRGHNRYTLIVEEAFALNAATGKRTDLNSVGFWFADQKDDNGCLGANSPVTPFDGDGKAGVQMMNSGAHKLP